MSSSYKGFIQRGFACVSLVLTAWLIVLLASAPGEENAEQVLSIESERSFFWVEESSLQGREEQESVSPSPGQWRSMHAAPSPARSEDRERRPVPFEDGVAEPQRESEGESVSGASEDWVEEGERFLVPEPPLEFGNEALPSETYSNEQRPEPQQFGENGYLGTIRRDMYVFSFPRLNMNDVPVARPNLTYWTSQKWDELEGQLQAAMRFGLTVYPHSPPPGREGNIVISGHSSPPSADYEGGYGRIFALLPDAQVGDSLVIRDGAEEYTYEVTAKRIVPATAVDVLLQDANKRELTLITCYPVGTTRERLVVKATLKESVKVALR